MSMPGFTAEASQYESHVSYRALPSSDATSTATIRPQALPPELKACYTCRSSCHIHFRSNPRLLKMCLDDCPCLFW